MNSRREVELLARRNRLGREHSDADVAARVSGADRDVVDVHRPVVDKPHPAALPEAVHHRVVAHGVFGVFLDFVAVFVTGRWLVKHVIQAGYLADHVSLEEVVFNEVLSHVFAHEIVFFQRVCGEKAISVNHGASDQGALSLPLGYHLVRASFAASLARIGVAFPPLFDANTLRVDRAHTALARAASEGVIAREVPSLGHRVGAVARAVLLAEAIFHRAAAPVHRRAGPGVVARGGDEAELVGRSQNQALEFLLGLLPRAEPALLARAEAIQTVPPQNAADLAVIRAVDPDSTCNASNESASISTGFSSFFKSTGLLSGQSTHLSFSASG
eukprot:CAMPEP_0174907822 /NCGR_PEP_ID=MMETSP0167-20121228/62240_1 /TAXON_ID=38298 /ORGANISM="Rhodella maculata, Strain CCMP736" /LENGTH=329 /DNA_ID=CAMNT_0016151391 /DNA_START=307 /DNA_END=1295 /DNA_ORIENTATION=+